MKLCNLLSGVSLGVLAFAAFETPARAQEQLPTIDVGAARPVAGGPGVGQGTNPGIEAAGNGPGEGGYGGAGPAQDPYNPTYSYENASIGTKTDTPVMETPLNVETVTQQVLKDQQVTTLAQALQNVSGVTVSYGGGGNSNGYPGSGITIRGFGTNGNIYRDGFRVDGSANYVPQQMANVQSVEVLKGAAAILYGLSEPGGIVNVITKQPLDAPYYSVNTQVGSLADYRTTIDATGPLNADKSLLYRMNMSYENNDAPFGSFVQNTGSESIFVAPVLKWIIDPSTWVKLEAQYLNYTVGVTQWGTPQLNGVLINQPRDWNYGEHSPALNRTIFTAFTWQHDFDKDWSIKQMIAYNRATNDLTYRAADGVDTTSYSIPTVDRSLGQNLYTQTTWSTNVDLTGHFDTFGVQHTFLTGLDFYRLNNYELATANYLLNSSVPLLLPPIHPGLPLLPPLLPEVELDGGGQDTAGLYVQDQIKLPYDLNFLAGARYQYIRQEPLGEGVPNFATNVLAPSSSVRQADTLQAVTPRFGLLWRPEKWVSAYIHYAEGFGLNSGVAYPDTPLPPTSARDVEAGLKFESPGGKLRGGVAVYDLTKTNVPEPDGNPAHQCPPNFGLLSCDTVAGEVRSKGTEVDVGGEILPGWNVTFAFTDMDVRITKSYPGDTSNTLGAFVPLTPRTIVNLSTNYEFQQGAWKGLKIGGGAHYNGSEAPVDGTGLGISRILPRISGYTTVDLYGSYEFQYGGAKWNAGINITNLFDKTYYVSAAYSSPLVGVAEGTRRYGAPFAFLGHLSMEWPGVPSSPSASPPPILPATFTWTGPYVGAQIGYAWGDNAGAFSYGTADGQFGSPPLVGDGQGIIFGGHAGYNHQIDKWVIGLEGSVDYTNLVKSDLLGYSDVNFDGGVLTANVQTDIQGAIRARAGYAFGRLLPFAAGGLAAADFKLQSNIGGYNYSLNNYNGLYYFAAANDRSVTRLGWTLGGGADYAIDNNWSVRGEYRYSDYGKVSEAPTSYSSAISYYSGQRHLTQNQVQVGFNYKFGDAPLDASGFTALAPSNSVQSQSAPQPVGTLGLPGPAAVTSTATGKPVAALAKPAAPPIDWTGFSWTGVYAGGQIGYAWGANHGGYSYVAAGGLAGSAPLTGDANGIIFGGHAGYNRQFDNWVVGLEGSVDDTNLVKTSALAVNNSGGTGIGTLTATVQSDVQGAVRARAGYAFGRLLTFAAGGVAFGDFSFQSNLASNWSALNAFYAVNNGQSVLRVGWTIGGGAEWAINRHWSVRGEYRYTDFGNFIDAPGGQLLTPGTFYSGGRHLDESQFQIGFDYKFGDAGPEPVSAPLLVKGPAVTADLRSPPPASQPASTEASPTNTLAKLVAPTIDWTGYSWTGFYAGGQVGLVWGTTHGAYSVATPGGLFGSEPLTGGAQVAIVDGHVGYNQQFNNWVVGLEGSIDGTNIVRTSTLPVLDPTGATPGGILTTAAQSNIQGTVRGRAGYAFGRLLTFATGGVAAGVFTLPSNRWGPDARGLFNAANKGQSMVRVGWTLGAGAEWAFTRNLSLRGEYRYTDFGTVTDTSTLVSSAGTSFSGTRRLDQNQLQFGFSYKFGDEAPASVIAKY